MDYPCVSAHILFYMHGPAILLFFELRTVNITKLPNGRYTDILNMFAPKN